jgi:hypothetical protein
MPDVSSVRKRCQADRSKLEVKLKGKVLIGRESVRPRDFRDHRNALHLAPDRSSEIPAKLAQPF